MLARPRISSESGRRPALPGGACGCGTARDPSPIEDQLENAAMTTVAHEAGIDRRRLALGKIVLGAALTALLATGCGASGAYQTTPPAAAASAHAAVAPKASSAPASVDTAAANAALALQSGLIDVVQTIGPSVVVIETDEGLGSGVIYDTAGNIVTNAPVTEGSTSFTVT